MRNGSSTDFSHSFSHFSHSSAGTTVLPTVQMVAGDNVTILENMSGEARPGRLLAIMGM